MSNRPEEEWELPETEAEREDRLGMLDIGVFSDPGVWGVVLADAVEHVANAFSQQGEDRDAVRQRVLEFFHKEINNPTDTVTGGIAQGDES